MREKKKERNINVRRIHRFPPEHTQSGMENEAWVCALSRNPISILLMHRTMPNPLSPMDQGPYFNFSRSTLLKCTQPRKLTYYASF